MPHAAYLAVADEAYGRAIPFAFLERVRDAFAEKYGDRGLSATEDSLTRAFGCAQRRCRPSRAALRLAQLEG